MRRTWLPILAAAAVAAAVAGSGCGAATPHAATPQKTPAKPPALRGEQARVAHAVGRLERALHDGDVERLCRPGAIFTAAVVQDIASSGVSCEASVEDTLSARGAPPMTVAAVAVEPGLANATVRVRAGRPVPLTLVRDRHGWRVSFSDGIDPLDALTG